MGSLVLIFFLVGLFCALAWIGWRFFVRSQMDYGLENVAHQAFKAVHKAHEKADPSNTHSVMRGRDGQGLNLTWMRWLSHWSIWVAFALVGLTVLCVLALSGRISIAPLEVLDFNRQQHIQTALNPEKLVPPPMLPPSMFANTERLGLETADRDWGRLNPIFLQRVLYVFARMEARGYPMAMLEGYRSPERQNMLASLGGHVTNAKAFQSKHQFGMALDAAPIKNGKLQISERDPWAMQAYQALGEEAEKIGLIWGGRWKLQDYGHIEAVETITAQLKSR
jgi:peptidoglycan L-alanyl-D-glutamate endopeptidase CwlK